MTKNIPVTDKTYWELHRKKQEMSQYMNKNVTWDEVVQHLFTRELISLRQGE